MYIYVMYARILKVMVGLHIYKVITIYQDRQMILQYTVLDPQIVFVSGPSFVAHRPKSLWWFQSESEP